MWPYTEVMFFFLILIYSGCLAESNGIRSNSEIPSKRISENDPKLFPISDSVLTASDISDKNIGYIYSDSDIDVKNIGYSDSDRSESDIDASDSKTTPYSDSDRSESDSDASDSKTTPYSDSDRSESGIQSRRNDPRSRTVTSALRLSGISEAPKNYGESKIKDENGLSTPKRFHRNGRQKNDRSKHRRERLRLNKEHRDVDFFEPIRMPQTFEEYDHNGDGYISLRELVDVTGAVVNAKYAFSDSDNDNNGKIDEEEFKRAPWDLSGQVGRVKHKETSSTV